MTALWNRTGHYIFVLWFPSLFLSFFFSSPNLSRRRLDVYHTSTHDDCGLSANLEFMSEMCCTWLARNAGPKKSPKNRRHCPDSGRLYINTDPVIQVVRGALEVFSDDVLVEATQGGDLFGMRLCHVPEDRGCLPSIRDE